MKKIMAAVLAALLISIAVPVLAASSADDNNTCPVRSCYENNAACNKGAYCNDNRAYCRDDNAYCNGPQRGHYRGGCGAGYPCGR